MDALTSRMFAVPGGWILDHLLAPVPDQDELRADLAITVGFSFWLVLLMVAFLIWIRVRSRMHRRSVDAMRESSAGIRSAHPSVDAVIARLRTHARAWTLRDAWGAVWRAQVVHVALYALVPLLWEIARWSLLIVFLPFTILSFADQKRGATDGTLDHLAQPACWTFVTSCPAPRSDFLHTPVIQASECVNYVCPPGRAMLPDSGGLLWKLLWALGTLAWVVPWLRGRASRSRRDLG